MVDLSVFILAVCFKNAKQFEQATDAYLKEAEYHTENKTYPWESSLEHDWLLISFLFVSPCIYIFLTCYAGFSMLQSKYINYVVFDKKI